MGERLREDNPNWKGGRVTEPRGYILIRVGIGHPLADCRGYAYEHRLKAYENGSLKIDGKRTHVHHGDEVKNNNDVGNLAPLTPWAHRAKHRKQDRGLQPPDSENPNVSCACGCGAVFLQYDSGHRPRKYVSGHNARRNSKGQFEVKNGS